MNNNPEISICIPAYKRIEYLERLLASISEQTYKNFEVIITDDSSDNSVHNFVKQFKGIEKILYYKNETILGTPENWNESIRKANGEWIKLMHDDDWFASKNSLQFFSDAIKKSNNCSFIFCAHNDVEEESGLKKTVRMGALEKFLLKKTPLNLMKEQYIGAPSNTLIRKNANIFYDNTFKWVVDFEFYIRCLQAIKRFYYIDQPLINISLNKEQVTKISFRNPEIEIPENHLLIEKLGYRILRNVFVYDYYWRFYRNLQIRNQNEIRKYYKKPINDLLSNMISMQRIVPYQLLKIGAFSKIFMILNYCFSLFKKI